MIHFSLTCGVNKFEVDYANRICSRYTPTLPREEYSWLTKRYDMKLDMIMWAIKPSVSEITVSKDMVTKYTAFEDTELVT